MNRIKEYYDCAVKFLELDEFAQMLIVTHFKVPNDYDTPENAAGLFKKILEQGKFEEFKRLIQYRSDHDTNDLH